MSSAHNAEYDRTLLAQAPVATRAQRQEGYDHVLLAPNRRAKRTQSDLELNEQPSIEPKALAHAAREAQSTPVQQSASFWPRRWKPIVGVVISLVVIAAIVGGAVGATSHKKKNSSSPDDTVGVSTLSASGQSSGIFDPSSIAAATPSASESTGKSLSQDTVAVATQPVPASDIFTLRTVRRHLSTARR
ncbi:hypothetical protein MVEN_01658800 [Mycena venus]|uniref:Uncharacterized protein n=1 Tax=Mycena venus TaxID=2733690 RepID=A0A8H6XR57_9AGAR|nr:hypothetical protein MVEN_01658800 [Mycena venus]